MCGITAFIKKSGPVDRASFDRMTNVLTHRGPDDSGTYYEDNFALGQRRLSIIDLSIAGRQPMHYMERYTIVFNGEIYNYIELKKELKVKGYSFYTETDTEVIMASYDCWGRDCLMKFNGMWSFVLYDSKNKSFFFARDRFGVKPFYYYYDKKVLLVASEIKAITSVMPQSLVKANVPRLLDNVMYGVFDHTEETLFNGILQLPAGYWMELNNNFIITKIKYYDVFDIKRRKTSYKNDVEIFKKLFLDSIKLRLRSDVPVGSCLSGGLDSSSIVCSCAKLLKDFNVRHDTVSSCYRNDDEKEFDEQFFIDKVVEATKVNSHKVYPSFDDFFNNIDNIIYFQDEPVGGLCHEAQFNVFKESHKLGLTVMLDGQGSDEQLAGYSLFHSVAIRDYIKHFNFAQAIKEIKAFKNNNTNIYGSKGLIWFMVKDLLPFKLRNCLIKFFTNRDEFSWLDVKYDPSIVENVLSYKDFDDYSKKSMKYGLVTLLHFEDRNSMANSIESRVPFLDYRLVEHDLSMPIQHKLLNGITKRVLRDAMDGILPEDIRNRKSKLGFAVPSDVWIMKYPEKVKAELSKSLDALSPLFNKERVMQWFDQNKDNKLALTNILLWRLICTGRWVRIFNVSIE